MPIKLADDNEDFRPIAIPWWAIPLAIAAVSFIAGLLVGIYTR